MLSENEPRFLRAVGFPTEYMERLKRVLSLLASYDYDGIDRNRETYVGEESYIDDLCFTLSGLRKVAPLPGADFDDARNKLQQKEEELKSELEDMVDDESPSPSPSKPDQKIEPRSKSFATRNFRIDDLFATL